MQITLELDDTGEQVDIEVLAVPRIGEQILWTDEVIEDHIPYDRQREYRVTMVDWTTSPGAKKPPYILLRCALLPEYGGNPQAEQETPPLAAFVAKHPPTPDSSALRMLDVWDHLSVVPAAQDRAPYMRQLAAAVRWVQQHHGTQVADSFVTYLSDAASSNPSS